MFRSSSRSRSRSSTWTAGGILATLLAGRAAAQAPSPSPPRAHELTLDRFTWSKDADGAAPIRAVEVCNDYGDVRARFAGDRRLEAHAVIQRLGTAPGVGVTVERRGDVIALTVAYPPGRIQDTDPDPPKDSYDRLDMVVFVPAGVAFSGHTLRGMVEARGLQSDVRAATRSGPIEVRTTGAIEAHSRQGNIVVFLSETSAGPVLLGSETGSIEVTLPAQADLDVRAETAGALDTILPLARSRHGERTQAAGHLGKGGPLVYLWSGQGKIQIR